MEPMSTAAQATLSRGRQAGVMLLEAMIAILIFSVGILAIVGMQGTAIQNMSEAKYRHGRSLPLWGVRLLQSH